MMESKRKQFKLLEQRQIDLIEKEVAGRKEQEKALVAMIEDKANGVRGDLAREAGIREEEVENLKACLEVRWKYRNDRTTYRSSRMHSEATLLRGTNLTKNSSRRPLKIFKKSMQLSWRRRRSQRTPKKRSSRC